MRPEPQHSTQALSTAKRGRAGNSMQCTHSETTTRRPGPEKKPITTQSLTLMSAFPPPLYPLTAWHARADPAGRSFASTSGRVRPMKPVG